MNDSEISRKLANSPATMMLLSIVSGMVLGSFLGAQVAVETPDSPDGGYPVPAPEDPPGTTPVSHVRVILNNLDDGNLSIALSVWAITMFSIDLQVNESASAILENVTGDILIISWSDGARHYASTLFDPLVDGWTLTLSFLPDGQLRYIQEEGQPV